MAQAATRNSSAVRKRHAAHPSHPKPAAKPNGGRSDGEGKVGEGEGKAGEGKLGAFLQERKPHLPAVGELSLPKPHLPTPHLPFWARLAGKLLKKLAKHELRRLTDGKHWSLESVAGDELEELRDRLGALTSGAGMAKPQLPIQESVDVAVPLDFAWSQWMELRFLPEGIDHVTDLERDGGELRGRIAGISQESWSAEVLDERECESFAWKSNEGSDCAGLITFHRLSERLTRLELTLDVLPRDAAQSALLLSHLADRRARRELRRFKADLEVVSPDVYADDESSSSR
jgi:uncharacterized membrane protein